MPASSTSLSSGSYRSTLSSTSSLDRPYYSSSSNSYVTPRSTRTYSNYRTTSSYVSEYRSSTNRLTYDTTERKPSYEYLRKTRAPSISDSDSGISGVYASRSERSNSRSRDASVTRSESSRTTRSDPLPARTYTSSSTADLYDKYSPSNYVPRTQRYSTTSTTADSSSRPPRRLRLQPETASAATATEVKLPRTHPSTTKPNPANNASNNSTVAKPCAVECATSTNTKELTDAANNSEPSRIKRDVECTQRQQQQQRKSTTAAKSSTTTTTTTYIPRARASPSWKPQNGHATSSTDDNGNDLLQLSVTDIRRKFDPKMTVTKLPAKDPDLAYKTARSSDNIYGALRSQEQQQQQQQQEKQQPVPVHKPITGSLKWEFSSSTKKTSDTNGDVSTIYIAGGKNAENSIKSQLNANNVIGKILEKSTTICVGDAKENVVSIDIGEKKEAEVARSKHTSDFASYIQISSPQPQKRLLPTVCNGDDSSPDDEAPVKHLLSPDEDATNLRYIDSEPSLDGDAKLIVDDANGYEEQGFENKTFEHANGHLLTMRKTKLAADEELSTDDDDDDDEPRRSLNKDEDLNSNNSAGSPMLSKRKYREVNGDANGYQIYQNENSITAKSTSPVNTLTTLSNSTGSTSPCGTLTTSRRRSVDSKSPQPGVGEQFCKTSGLNGLRNIGNTCFMNSVVQCLSNTKPLLEYCGTPDSFAPHINTTLSCMKGALIKAFSTVITELWKADEKDGVVNTTSLKAQIQRFAPRFMGYSQQDAQEFLRYLLEGLHEDVNRVTVKPKPILTEIDENLSDAQKAEESWQRYLRSEDSKVGDIFVGQLKSSLRCTHCSHTSVTFDPFWDLSLPIPSRTGQLKLSQCLSHFTREEELDGDEKPTCSKCQVRRKCLKWFTVQKFPRVLVLHLKRFSPTERFRGKLNVSVEFPLVGLDMTPFAASASPGARGPPPSPAVYNLYAVSNHSGTTYSGHYTAYCKHPYNGEWHEYNDSRVSPISPRNVVSNEAYVLFYELASGSASS